MLLKKNLGFNIYFYVFGFSRCNGLINSNKIPFFFQRYDTEQECEGTEECTGTWFTTLWGDCTEPCGGGTYTREVKFIFCEKATKFVKKNLILF